MTPEQREIAVSITREQLVLDVLAILRARINEQFGSNRGRSVEEANADLAKTVRVFYSLLPDEEL